jgi:chemotaxis protein methyltransferase CheR
MPGGATGLEHRQCLQEPYSLAILGTEVDPRLLQRSHQACYPATTIKNLPPALRRAAFTADRGGCCLQAHFRSMVEFQCQDIRRELPEGEFDLILCRNLVFTYFDAGLQQCTLQRLLTRLRRGGWLVLGVHEALPAQVSGLNEVSARLGLYRY